MDRITALSADPANPLADLAEVIQVPDSAMTTTLPALQPLLQHYEIHGVISVGNWSTC
jgi:hypothetical protein